MKHLKLTTLTAALVLGAGALAVGCAIGKISMEQLSRGVMIFYIPMLIVLALITYIPALTLWLPNLCRR